MVQAWLKDGAILGSPLKRFFFLSFILETASSYVAYAGFELKSLVSAEIAGCSRRAFEEAKSEVLPTNLSFCGERKEERNRVELDVTRPGKMR